MFERQSVTGSLAPWRLGQNLARRDCQNLATLSEFEILAVLAIAYARIGNEESFVIGRCVAEAESVVAFAETGVEPADSFNAVMGRFERIRYGQNVDAGAKVGIVGLFADSPFGEANFTCENPIDYVCQIDRSRGQFTVHCSADVGSQETAEVWADAIGVLFDQINRPGQRDKLCGSVNLASHEIQQRVLEFGCSDKHQFPEFYSLEPSPEFTFHHQFEQQVERTPDRIALKASENSIEVSWSYRKLNREANLIAQRLIKAGVKVEDTIGLVMNRRCCMLASMIGIMKAGGRYVSLESSLPNDRLAFMVEDASIKAVITDAANVDRTHEMLAVADTSAPVEVVNWDGEAFREFSKTVGDAAEENPQTPVHSRNGAYVIYTSGSTGKPKGVDVWHHSFVNFCASFAQQLNLDHDDTCLAITTIAFDVSIAELFPLLRMGGTVVLGGSNIGADGQMLSAMIKKVSATYLCATPTSLRILVASGWEQAPNLTVVVGGEPVSALNCNEVGPRVGRMVNGYGPTEGTVYATLGSLSPDQIEPVPIGPPILNSRLYVLDDHRNLLPPLAAGKLFIGGQSPARGYLNRPELTDEKFVDDPFVDRNAFPDAKMYDSGDVVYWRHDGILQYLGRSDHQVKIRGYRIELGEIEDCLCGHPDVNDCVVIAREDIPGQPRLVAYVIYRNKVQVQALQDHLAADLPNYMVPAWFVGLESFPTNANFKLDRKALPNPDDVLQDDSDSDSDSDLKSDLKSDLSLGREEATSRDSQQKTLATDIARIWSEVLNRKIRVDDHVFRMGADSLRAVKFQLRMQEEIGQQIAIGEVFQYPTPIALAKQLSHEVATTGARSGGSAPRTAIRDIAIVGLAGRFPGAANVDQFWENLVNGVESIVDFSEEELAAAGVKPSEYLDKNYIARGTVLDDAYDFEPEFFGVTRSDAEVISPQIRLFMKTAWEAIEHAGYPVEPDDSRIGVYVGGGLPNYLAPWRHIPEAQRLQRLIGNGADFMATRTSYALGLTGPAIGIQTACSSSLVAVASAVEAIRTGKCEMAIAGGSSFSWPHGKGYQHGEGLIYSADGHCRAFDENASGTLFSQAAGAVLLRPLEDAIANGDTIHAVIKGVGVNNDGNRKGGFASPSIQGQSEVVRMALDDAGVTAQQISLMEAHGTGTKIGDPIEISGLKQAWRQDTNDTQYCALGSVKANVGHADAAAGIVGLLKVVMSLKHRKIAPLINFNNPNPAINFEASPFYINQDVVDWENDGNVRFAAISSFGMGGTNAHAVLCEGHASEDVSAEEPPVQVQPENKVADEVAADVVQPDKNSLQLIPFSARTEESLEQIIQRWRDGQWCQFDLADIVHTLHNGRKHFKRRTFAVVDSADQLCDVLDQYPRGREGFPAMVACSSPAVVRSVVFSFTGQGAQYPGMAKELYEQEPVFRAAIERCDQALQQTGSSLVDWLYDDLAQVDVKQTQYAQLALFAVSYAQAKLWQSWGVEPSALVGHSIGEYAAAAIAGVMSVDDAIRIVQQRGRLMQQQPVGSMLAVMHGETPIETLLELDSAGDVDLAVVNSPTVAVVAGEATAIERFVVDLESRDISSKKLHTSHAFHSRMMDSMLDEFVKAFAGVSLSPPKIDYLSNVSGTWITPEQATDPKYYASQIRSTVRFSDDLKTLFADDEEMLLLEMGPGKTLTQLAKSQFAGKNHAAISTLPSAKEAQTDSRRFAFEAAGRAWGSGLELDWDAIQRPVEGVRRRRVPLPTYQYNEQTYRAKPELIGAEADSADEGNWYNIPSWRQSYPSGRLQLPEPVAQRDIWLLLEDGSTKTDDLAQLLGDGKTIHVVPGDKFSQTSNGHFTIRPENPDDYPKLLEAIGPLEHLQGVVHAWSLSAGTKRLAGESGAAEFWRSNEQSVLSLAWLSKAIGDAIVDRTIPLNVVTTGVCDVDPEIVSRPANHGLIGGGSVIQKEYRSIATKVIDVGESLNAAVGSDGFFDLLRSHHHEPLLAFDRRQWWALDFEQVDIADASQPVKEDAEVASVAGASLAVVDGSVLVFSGGLGGVARNMAIELAGQHSNLAIALLVRTPLPQESTWDQLLADSDVSPETRQRIVDVRQLRSLCRLEIIQCDVADGGGVAKSLKAVRKKFGKIDSILHCAGVLDDGIVATRTDQTLRSAFVAKSLAAENLCREVLKNHTDVQHVVLFSSISADLGMFGQFAYSAANNYLDGLCQGLQDSKQGKQGPRFCSINWPAFRDVGMAARTQVNLSSDAALTRELADNSFTVAEGTKALVEVMGNCCHHRVVVSKKPFSGRLAMALADSNSVKISVSAAGDRQGEGGLEDTAEQRMLAIWQEQFGNPDLDLEVNYFELGGDSLMAIGMIAEIEKVFGKTLPISHLINSPTPGKLLKRLGLNLATGQNDDAVGSGDVSGNVAVDSDSLPLGVLCLRESDSGNTPMFLVHGADGSVLFYRSFANRLRTQRPIYGLESPNLTDSDWEIPETVEELASRYVASIRAVQSSGPYLIGGYSFGGVLAFEIANQLEEAGESIEALILYDISNPSVTHQRKPMERIRAFWNRQGDSRKRVKVVELTRRTIQAFRDRAVIEVENRIARTKSADTRSPFWRHRKARERHMLIEEYYVPQRLQCPLRIVAATGNSSKFRTDHEMGWGDVSNDLEVLEVPGKHLELFGEEYVGGLLESTEEFLKETAE